MRDTFNGGSIINTGLNTYEVQADSEEALHHMLEEMRTIATKHHMSLSITEVFLDNAHGAEVRIIL